MFDKVFILQFDDMSCTAGLQTQVVSAFICVGLPQNGENGNID